MASEKEKTASSEVKKTTTKKQQSNKTSSTSKKNTEKSEIKEVVVKAEPKKYGMSDYITCKSVRYGKLSYIAKKSGMLYEWSDFGDICEVEYGDLLALKASKSVFLYEPWFIILDDELAKQWNLTSLYSYFEELEEAEEFISTVSASELRKRLMSAPKGYKDIILYTAGRMVREHRLDSISTIRAIDDVMHTKLASMVGE